MVGELSTPASDVWSAFSEVAERVGVFEDYGDALAAGLRAMARHVPSGADFIEAVAGELEG